MMEDLSQELRLLLSSVLSAFKEEAFLTKPVGELLWGYDSQLANFLNKFFPGMLPASGKFGLFAEVRHASPPAAICTLTGPFAF